MLRKGQECPGGGWTDKNVCPTNMTTRFVERIPTMRKDVRMGFAVGGVLLAVLVVAILFFHHNKNADRAVAFDSGGKSAVTAGNDQQRPMLRSVQRKVLRRPTASPAPTAAPVPAANTLADPKAPADDAAQKGGNQWDVLFASTAEDPIKARLTSETLNKPKDKSKKHKSDAATSTDVADRHDSAAIPAVANTPLNTGSVSAPTTVAPARTASDRLTSQSSRESGRTHVIAQGETFVSIARAVYGDGRYYQSLIDANPSIDPDKLKPGMTISASAGFAGQAVTQQVGQSLRAARLHFNVSDGKTYTVQNGDSLYKIAKKLYGNGQKSDDLYEANKQTHWPRFHSPQGRHGPDAPRSADCAVGLPLLRSTGDAVCNR